MGKPNPLKNVYFGEQHLHTQNSPEAFAAGSRQTRDEAFRYGRGEEVTLHTIATKSKIKRGTPYDFMAITDHAEYFGSMPRMIDPKDPLHDILTSTGRPQYTATKLLKDNWQNYVKVTNKYNEPGKFTALIAFEWTSIPNGANMHRNVFFKDKPATAPFSSFDSVLPEDLWTYLEIQRNQEGIDVFAIPHNSNVSDGWMFSERKFIGTPKNNQYASRNLGMPIDTRYAERQQANEPLFEIHQTKGNSEAHPWLSPNDEFANFEPFPSLISLGTPSQIKGGFYRQGLVEGMKIESEVGYNPYKMGVVAGADVHSGYQGNEEWDWNGAHGNLDDTPQKRLNPVKNATGENGYNVSSAGTAAVWATENTREAIWNAMQRKETYATTGSRMTVRFFGGWDFEAADATTRLPAEVGYKKGVPMGGDLTAAPTGKAPSFLVAAPKHPHSGNPDRIQIVKGWHERVEDVAWSGERRIGADGKLPPVGSNVDVANANWTNTIGDAELDQRLDRPGFRSESTRVLLRARDRDPETALDRL